MRPERIELAGFGSFRDPTTVDLDDVDAFALVGPTGAGKSTLIDAICFALYGSVPRYDDQRLVGAAITAGANEARVRCTFTIGSRRYVVARVVRRGREGRASTKEARLEELLPDGGTRSLAAMAKEVTAGVEQLLGLPFEHFTRCVVLPQGTFARFLHDKPADRQDLLVRLLGLDVYERIGQRARLVAREAQGEAAADERRLAALATATPEALEAARARRAALAEVVGAVEAASEHLGSLDARVAAARQARERSQRLVSALDAVSVPAGVVELVRRRGIALAAVEEAETNLKEAAAWVVAVHDRLDGIGSPGPLHAARRAHVQRCAVAEDLARAEAERAPAVEAVAAALRQLVQAEADEDTARATVAEAERRHAARRLASNLVPGDDCPVCLRPVDMLFVPDPAAPPADLAAAAGAVDEQVARTRAARRRHEAATHGLASVTSRADALRAQVTALDVELAHQPDAGTVEAALAEYDVVSAALETARDDELAARRSLEAAEQQRRRVDRESQRFVAALHAQRDPLVELGPPRPGEDLAASWTELAAWASERRPGEAIALATATAEVSALAGERRERLEALATAARAAGVRIDADAGLAALQRDVARAEASSEHAVATIEAALAEAGTVAERVASLLERAQVAGELARLLMSSGFERWLVAGALDELVTGASDTLGQLSGGQYSLGVDDGGDLVVIDHRNADELRPVRTLSGGETFQAALALALTLSERLAALAGAARSRLEAIFLDEGFGTLDAESLDTVAATIEAVATEGRMVGVVTHVGALADRIPVRYVVAKGASTSTVRREVG